MAWTAPMTATTGQVFTAAAFNTNVRDNMLETEVAKAGGDGSLLVTTGANAITSVSVKSATVTASQSTTNIGSYVDLSTFGPSVTLNTGTSAMVFIQAEASNDNTNSASFVSVAVTGATSIPATDDASFTADGVQKNNPNRMGMMVPFKSLNPGLNTFTMKYKAGSGRASFANRTITVLPL